MPDARRKLITGIVSLLLAGAFVGWVYDRPALGMLIAALIALFWQLRQMLIFENALKDGNFDAVRYGSEFWSQAFGRFDRLKNRGQKHKKRYRRLLKEVRKSTNAMPDGAIILDDRFEVKMCNPAAQALVGFDPRLDRGQRVDNILRDPTFSEYLASDDPDEGIEIPSPLRDGDWLYCRIVPYGENQRLLLIRDVTERVSLNKMRRDFVANASHELRSPLTVITGYLDGLAGDPDAPEEWQRPLEQMRSQVRRMTSIVSELIELSQLEAAGSASRDTDVDVPSLLERVVHALKPGDSGPALELDVRSSSWLRGSSSEFESIVTNLVSNAIRHTDGDGSVAVTWADEGAGAALTVSDTGEGIAEEHLPRLTERFFRVDRGRSRAEGGVGLGLAIVKYALNRHDAELDIQSEISVGSTFTCRFPPSRVVAPSRVQDAAAG